MCKPDYPNNILPNSKKAIYSTLESFKDSDIVRISDSNPAFDLLKGSYTLCNESIGNTSKLLDWSTILLGEFKLDYCKFKTNSNFNIEYWDGRADVNDISKECYDINEGKDYLFFNCSDLLNINVKEDIKAFYSIYHTPTNCNYWHTSLKLSVDDKIIESNENNLSKYRKILKQYIRPILTELAFPNPNG